MNCSSIELMNMLIHRFTNSVEYRVSSDRHAWDLLKYVTLTIESYVVSTQEDTCVYILLCIDRMKGNFEDSWRLVKASLLLLRWTISVIRGCLNKVQVNSKTDPVKIYTVFLIRLNHIYCCSMYQINLCTK